MSCYKSYYKANGDYVNVENFNDSQSFCNGYCGFMYNGIDKQNCATNCINNDCAMFCPSGLGDDKPGAVCNLDNARDCIDKPINKPTNKKI